MYIYIYIYIYIERERERERENLSSIYHLSISPSPQWNIIQHKKEWNLAICNNMDRARGYNVKQNKLVREWQTPYDFTCMQNLRNETDEHKGKEGKIT